MRKFTAYAIAGALTLAALTGCAGKDTVPEPGTAEPQTAAEDSVSAEESEDSSQAPVSGEVSGKNVTITVTYVKSPLNVPSIVEKELGAFREIFGEAGYEVAYSDLTTGPEQTQALASGDIQFLNAVGATSVILSAANDADIKIISMYSRSPKAFKLFSKDNTIQSPEDLRGKKIAGPKGTILHELLVAYLKTADMTEDDIEFMAMGIPDSQAALAGGSVDAALSAGPAAYNMEKDGYHIVTDGEGLTEASIVTATSTKFYEEHPELVKAFLDAQKSVLNYMKEHYDEAVSMTAQATELSEEAVKEMYGLYDFQMEITGQDIDAMEKTKDFMLENEMIETDVAISDLILKIE